MQPSESGSRAKLMAHPCPKRELLEERIMRKVCKLHFNCFFIILEGQIHRQVRTMHHSSTTMQRLLVKKC